MIPANDPLADFRDDAGGGGAGNAAADLHGDAGAWGAIGEPLGGKGFAQLLHVLRTDVATLRHAFLSGVTVPGHRRDRIAILYVFGGPILDAGTCVRVFSRRLVYQPFGHEQSLYFRGPTHVLCIEIPVSPFPGGALPRQWSPRTIPMPAPLYDHIWRVLVAIATRARPEVVTALLAEFVRQARRFATRAMPAWLDEAVKDIHANWRTPPDVEALAARCGFSVQHFYRAWKKHMGVTPGHYARILRLDHARGLIWATDTPISQVAAETGFTDQSHLNRILVAHTGIPPMKLRSMAPCLPRKLFPGREGGARGSRA